jgi:hypothetical protein
MAQRIAGGLRGRGLPGRLIAFAALLATGLSAAAADVLAIVPDVSEPYRAVLYQIVDGMRRSASVRLVQIPSGAAPGRPALTVEGERVAIALGGTAVHRRPTRCANSCPWWRARSWRRPEPRRSPE